MTVAPRRLLCDEMLAGLARWLRAAGHDAALAPAGTNDATVLDSARREGRRLLTRDAALADAAGPDATLLTGRSLDEQAAEVARVLQVNWTAAPFTRCLLDNVALRPATGAERAAIPPSSQDLPGPFVTCPACNRTYWPGSHVRRMTARLERWWAGQPTAFSSSALDIFDRPGTSFFFASS